ERRPSGAEILKLLRAGELSLQRPSPASRRQYNMPFLGRDEHMAALDNAYRDSQAGRAVVMLLHGASGMGKTTLTRHFLDEVRRKHPGALLLSGRCYEQE